jgi:hypothetical protein
MLGLLAAFGAARVELSHRVGRPSGARRQSNACWQENA